MEIEREDKDNITLKQLKKELKKMGGYEQVETEGKWEEVAIALSMPKSQSKRLRSLYIQEIVQTSPNKLSNNKMRNSAKIPKLELGSKTLIQQESQEEEEEYIVERISGKRKRYGRVQYLLKWEGYPEDKSTWEYEENMNCPELVAEYEASQQTKKRQRKRGDFSKDQADIRHLKQELEEEESQPNNDQQKIGFEYGDTVDEIIGAKMMSGELYHFCSWIGHKDATLVPAKVSNLKIPQKVIAFYESRLKFEEPEDLFSQRKTQSEHESTAQTTSQSNNNILTSPIKVQLPTTEESLKQRETPGSPDMML